MINDIILLLFQMRFQSQNHKYQLKKLKTYLRTVWIKHSFDVFILSNIGNLFLR